MSFSVAALLGILALLGGGSFGETEGRVLLTTVIVGVESVAALCYLGLAGHRLAPIAAAGGVVSIAATVLALWPEQAADKRIRKRTVRPRPGTDAEQGTDAA